MLSIYIKGRLFLNYYTKYKILCIITAPVVPTACLRVRYAGYAFTRLVHQPPTYASGALLRH